VSDRRLRALLAGGAAGAVAAIVIGIPAARAGGLTLAVTTLALAPAVLFWLLNPEFFDWVGAPRSVVPVPPTGVYYMDNDGTTQNQSGDWAIAGGNDNINAASRDRATSWLPTAPTSPTAPFVALSSSLERSCSATAASLT